MGIENLLILLVTNLWRTLINQKFITLFFDKSTADKRVRNVAFIFFFIFTSIGYLMFTKLEVNIITNILGLFIMTAIYQGNIKKKILIVFLIYFLNMSCDVVVMRSIPFYPDMEDINQLKGSMTVFLIAVCEIGIEKISMKRRNSDEVSPDWKFLLIVPFCSMIMIHFLMISGLYENQILLIEGIGLLIINIASFYLYSAMEDSYVRNMENEIAAASAKIYANQLDIIMNTQDQVRSLQHDMKFHFRELMSMAEDKNLTDMYIYLEKMNQQTDNPDEFVYSGNKEIDSNLNYLLKKAHEKLVDVSVSIKVPEGFNHSPYDINVIISNLLENAISASEKSSNKMLRVSLLLEKSVLFIAIENSYNGVIRKKGNIILTEKYNVKMHGYGLKNVKRIVKLYDGVMNISDENNIFSVDVMLYLP